MNKSTLLPGLLVTAALALALAGCIRVQDPYATRGQAGLTELTTAASVSPDNRPLSAASSFLATTPAIYVTARVNEAPANTTVGARWTYVKDQSGAAKNQALGEDSKTVKGSTYVSFSRQSSNGWAIGQYSVSLLLNGKDAGTVDFSVQGAQGSSVPAPTISYFKAVPEAISTGQAVTLSWSVSDAAQVQVSTIGSVSPAGNTIVLPVTSTEYELTATNPAGKTSMKVKVNVTSFNTDKPELVITDFHTEGDKAYYKIKNIGGVNSKPSTTLLYVEGNNRASSLVDVLPAGEERQQAFSNYQWPYGGNRTFKIPVRVCADSQNVIGEYDENNNCLTLDW